MARIDWVEQRLQNWARWTLLRGSGVNGYAGVDWGGMAEADAGRSGYITATIPVVEVEASDTDDAVHRLPSELRAAVESTYLGQGTVRERCTRLCIAEPTMHKRVDRAHRLLADHWEAKRQAQEAERARVQQVSEQARPQGFYTGE